MLTDKQKEEMKLLAGEYPALKAWAHDVLNHLAASIGNLYLLERANNTPEEAALYRERARMTVEDAVRMFRESGL